MGIKSAKLNSEIKQLLNIKFDDLDNLDLLEEDSEGHLFLDPEEITSPQEKQTFYQCLQDIPKGKEGFEHLQESQKAKAIDGKLENCTNGAPDGPPLHDALEQIGVKDRTSSYKKGVQDVYDAALSQIEQLFLELIRGNRVKYSRIQEITDPFTKNFMTDQAIIQNLSVFYSIEHDYLPNHFLRNFLLAINIGSSSGYSLPQVKQMGEAALLADIGMIMINGDIRIKKDALTQEDEWELKKHPIIGLYALERLNGIPDEIVFVAYQHHERLTGDGYPKGNQSRVIHPYAQIVAIADIFDALCNERAYRGSYNPSESLKSILKMAVSGHLDKTYVHNLIKYLSAFPVGSLVLLNDNRMAKVIQSNAGSPLKPLISVLTDKKEQTLSEKKIFQIDCSQEEDIYIERPLNIRAGKNEVMIGF
ncbi:MAG: HD domain-containing protein [Fibrobacteria bacterium]|nr:HD domain-containing protein [Fibrobacteria bacterium]